MSADRTRLARTRLVVQAVQAALGEPAPPPATVVGWQPSRAAISPFASPVAAASTIRQRKANACALFGRLAQRSSVSRSSSLSVASDAGRLRRAIASPLDSIMREGFAVELVPAVNPDKLFGAAFPPLVSIAVIIALFDSGLDQVRRGIVAEERGVVRRLRDLGIPIAWAGAGLLIGLLLWLSFHAAVMLGAIPFVSGPTLATPITAGRTGSALRATSLSKRSEVADAGDDEGHEVVGGDP